MTITGANNSGMDAKDNRRGYVTDEHKAEAAALRRIWDATKEARQAAGVGSQAAFAQEFDIGGQPAVSSFLKGETALSLKAARGFARGLKCQIGDFSQRLAKEAASLAGVAHAPGDLPFGVPVELPVSHRTVAHSTSQPSDTLTQRRFEWRELVSLVEEDPERLPARFEVDVPDDALGKLAPKGRVVEFTRADLEEPRFGDGVLVVTAQKKVYFRIYRENLATEAGWEAAAVDENFATLEPVKHGAKVIAVMTRGPRWS